ncbi:MAG: DUF481 domain-containing protein [Opitutaceae bacterium]
MSNRLRILAFLLSFVSGTACLHGSDAASTVLVLQNGDRITGHEVKREDGVIHFQSDLLGLIRIVEAKAKVEASTETDLDLQLAATGAPSAGFPEQGEAAEQKKKEEKKKPPPVLAATDDKPEKALEIVSLKRTLEFGFTDQSGRRDRTDISVRANIERKTKSTELRFQGRYLYGESNDERSTDNLTGSARYRRDLSPRLFAQVETKYQRDPIKRIDNDFTQSIGMGRNLIERAGLKLAFGGGAAVRYRDLTNEEAAWLYQVDAFQDLVYTINSHFKVTQDLSVLATPSDADEFSLELGAALTSKLTNTLNMSMRYEFEYDRSLSPTSRQNQRIVTSVGYAF